MSTVSSFRSIENKHDIYRGKDSMKKFCEFLREHAIKILFLKKGSYWQKSSRNRIKIKKSATFVNKNLRINIWKIKNIVKLEIIVIIQGNIEVLHIAYVI